MITQELYEKLNAMLTNDQQVGEIVVKLANVRCKIKGKDAIGHLVQEWFFEWCKKHKYKVLANAKTQSFPDYFINLPKGGQSMLEIKNFNIDASPAFDVADFYAFVENLPDEVHKLDADYIIFGYKLDSKGNLTIPKLWKKKIWQIVGRSPTNYITCQIRGANKDNPRIQKFRPYNFKIEDSPNGFNSPIEFLQAIQKLLSKHKVTKSTYKNWYSSIVESPLFKDSN